VTAFVTVEGAALLEAASVRILSSQGPVDEINVREFGEHTTSMIPTFDNHYENVFYLIPAEICVGDSCAIQFCVTSHVGVLCTELCNLGEK